VVVFSLLVLCVFSVMCCFEVVRWSVIVWLMFWFVFVISVMWLVGRVVGIGLLWYVWCGVVSYCCVCCDIYLFD